MHTKSKPIRQPELPLNSQTVRETLPEGFQRSEFLLSHGAIDLILDRRDQRERIGSLLRLLMRQPAVV